MVANGNDFGQTPFNNSITKPNDLIFYTSLCVPFITMMYLFSPKNFERVVFIRNITFACSL